MAKSVGIPAGIAAKLILEGSHTNGHYLHACLNSLACRENQA